MTTKLSDAVYLRYNLTICLLPCTASFLLSPFLLSSSPSHLLPQTAITLLCEGLGADLHAPSERAWSSLLLLKSLLDDGMSRKEQAALPSIAALKMRVDAHGA